MVVKVLEFPIEVGVKPSNLGKELDEDFQRVSGYSSPKRVESRTFPTPQSIIALPPSCNSSPPPLNATSSAMMMEVYKDIGESGDMHNVFETTVGMEDYQKTLDIATRMELCENVPSNGKMVGELIEVEKVYSWPSPILDRLNNWIKKVQVK
jgi:hypothetical protein